MNINFDKLAKKNHATFSGTTDEAELTHVFLKFSAVLSVPLVGKLKVDVVHK